MAASTISLAAPWGHIVIEGNGTFCTGYAVLETDVRIGSSTHF